MHCKPACLPNGHPLLAGSLAKPSLVMSKRRMHAKPIRWEPAIMAGAQECLAGLAAPPQAHVGVYVGAMWAHEFVEVLPQLGLSAAAANSSTGNTAPFLVGRCGACFGLGLGHVPRQYLHAKPATSCCGFSVTMHYARG